MARSVSSCSITGTRFFECDRSCHVVLFFTQGVRRRKCAKSPFPMASGEGTASDPHVRLSGAHATAMSRMGVPRAGGGVAVGSACGVYRRQPIGRHPVDRYAQPDV